MAPSYVVCEKIALRIRKACQVAELRTNTGRRRRRGLPRVHRRAPVTRGLPDNNGFEICRTLRDEFGDDLPIIFVSGERVAPADRAVGLLVGGDDYLVKPVDPDEFLARVRRAVARSRREPAVPSTTTSRSLDLTKRELEVLELLAQGQTQAQIASALVISPKTVASHVQRILAKLGVHSRAQAVALAYQSGAIRGPTSSGQEARAMVEGLDTFAKSGR